MQYVLQKTDAGQADKASLKVPGPFFGARGPSSDLLLPGARRFGILCFTGRKLELQEGCKILRCTPCRRSFWARARRLVVHSPSGSP